jgi:3-deoxy-7-phosphoheptulonate synthase
MHQTNNLHVVDTVPLLAPDTLKAEFALTDQAAEVVFVAREQIRAVLRGEDQRLLAIVGPCSIHDPDAARDYASQLRGLVDQYRDALLIVMRVYFEKPRTSVGWKGLINDPHLNDTCDIPTGLRHARRLLLDIAQIGLPAATEMLDPILPQYMADLVSWAGIGARTTESQPHRELASGLSMPVGFKNGTDGGLEVAINAMLSAASSHSFLGVDGFGRVSIVNTSGNPDCHLVLRGGSDGPNYDAQAVQSAVTALSKAGVRPHMIIDCSHDNSGKNHEKQPDVLSTVAEQVANGSRHVVGVMIESNLVGGRQALNVDRSKMTYGQSVTDACVDFPTTQRMLEELAQAVRHSRRRAA